MERFSSPRIWYAIKWDAAVKIERLDFASSDWDRVRPSYVFVRELQ